MTKDRFNQLKQEVTQILNSRGWDDKDRVDLRSVISMIDYLRFYEVIR